MNSQGLETVQPQKISALIPARDGSKGIQGKNIRSLAGYPMIAYSIIAAKLCSEIDQVIVSTNSQHYAEISMYYGAEVPFLRPSKYSQDTSEDRDVVLHYLNWCRANLYTIPDLIIYLRPTTPLRDPMELSNAISKLQNDKGATSLRSAHELSEPPQKMFQLNPEGNWEGFFPDDPRTEYFNLPRQSFPTAYHPNGYIDILKTSILESGNAFFGDRIMAYITPNTVEIDQPEDLKYLNYVISQRQGDHLVRHLKSHFKSNFGKV